MQNLLLKAANDQKYLEEYNIVCEIYKDDFNAFSLQAQLKLPEFLQGSNYLSISALIIATANYLKPLTIVANISIIKCFKTPTSASDNSLSFYYTKAILTSLISELW